MMHESMRTVSLPTNQGEARVSVRDVLWIHSNGPDRDSYCHIHTTEGSVESTDYFEKVLRVMGDSFLYCLDRGAVNMHHMVRMEGNDCLLDDGTRLLITPFLALQVKEAWCRFLCRQVWED